MAEQLLSQAQDLFEGQIDFEGQKLTEIITTALLLATGLLALILGYFQENIHVILWVGLLGTGITFFVVVPPWPAFNESPEKWLPAKEGKAAVRIEGIQVDGKKIT